MDTEGDTDGEEVETEKEGDTEISEEEVTMYTTAEGEGGTTTATTEDTVEVEMVGYASVSSCSSVLRPPTSSTAFFLHTNL